MFTNYLKPAIGLVLGAVGNKLKDGGGVVAGVVLLAVWEEDARDELPVHDLVLLLTVHLVRGSFRLLQRIKQPIGCMCVYTCTSLQLMIALFFNHLRFTPGSLNSTSKL